MAWMFQGRSFLTDLAWSTIFRRVGLEYIARWNSCILGEIVVMRNTSKTVITAGRS